MIRREDRDETRDIEQTRDGTVRNDQPKRTTVFGGAPMRADEHAQTRRIKKLELREIDDEVVAALFRSVAKRRTYGWGGRQVEASAEFEE